MAAASNKSVLFVCLGNICRSTMAEQLLTEMVAVRSDKDEWKIDSAATSTYEIGSKPDDRTNTTLEKHKRSRCHHIARQITKDDYSKFKYIFGFDESNISNITRKNPSGSGAIIKLLGEYDPSKERIIEDPYYGEMSDFQNVYDQCSRCLTAFLEKEFS